MACETDVAVALLARCATLTHGSPVMPVAMPDVTFAPPKAANGSPLPYFRVDLFRNAPFWSSLAHGKKAQGLLQVTVVWPRGKGIIQPSLAADAVEAHFPKNLRLPTPSGTVKISGDPWAAAPLIDDTDTETPVTIPWRA